MPATHTRISVILPFYKAGQELDLAIQSISRQTFTDWELLLVNNNASAGAIAIAEKWTGADPRIRLLHEPVQGIAFALNTGLHQAGANLIARMDADDISHSIRFEKQISFLDANPEVDVVSTQTTFHSNLELSEGYDIFTQWQNNNITPEEHYISRFIESPLAHPTVMFRKKLIEKFGRYSTANVPEDYELWLRWFDKSVRFYKIPEPLLQWNDHPQRLSRTHDNYSKEAFYTIKCTYLAAWMKRSIPPKKKVVICGSSKIVRKRADLLRELGVDVFGYTDVKRVRNRSINFVPLHKLNEPENWLIVNFISKRGVRESVRTHFMNLGFVEGQDFILAA
jgi:glycosyltransferase involved in cell wall biosynthesis